MLATQVYHGHVCTHTRKDWYEFWMMPTYFRMATILLSFHDLVCDFSSSPKTMVLAKPKISLHTVLQSFSCNHNSLLKRQTIVKVRWTTFDFFSNTPTIRISLINRFRKEVVHGSSPCSARQSPWGRQFAGSKEVNDRRTTSSWSKKGIEIMVPGSGNQAWLNGKCTIEIGDFPIKTSIHRGVSSAMFDCQRVNPRP